MSASVFAPTPRQRRLLDFMHENPSCQNTLALCRAAGVSRANFYRWCKDPGFCLWFGSAWAARLLMEGAFLINTARALAPEKFSYWKALFELTFDPKGLALLAKWQSSLGQLSPDAFLAAPDRGPLAEEAQVPAHKWPTEEEWNLRHGFGKETLSAPMAPQVSSPKPSPFSASTTRPPLPGQAARAIARALRRISAPTPARSAARRRRASQRQRCSARGTGSSSARLQIAAETGRRGPRRSGPAALERGPRGGEDASGA
ncbi:MAG: hypothetical protein ACRD1Y_12875 [Terriglobales bacterium]